MDDGHMLCDDCEILRNSLKMMQSAEIIIHQIWRSNNSSNVMYVGLIEKKIVWLYLVGSSFENRTPKTVRNAGKKLINNGRNDFLSETADRKQEIVHQQKEDTKKVTIII